MKHVIAIGLSLVVFDLGWSQETSNSCEVMMVETLDVEGPEESAIMQSFAPATEFLASVYDDKTDIVRTVEGRKIQAVLCERADVIPTLRDFQILATGIPMALSTDFDASDSPSITIYFKSDKFHSVVKGPEMSETDQTRLDDAMSVFNLQPHGLGEK